MVRRKSIMQKIAIDQCFYFPSYGTNVPSCDTICVLDWAAETERFKTEKRRSPYTKVAVEARLVQLFDLCRRQLDLMYFRYQDQKLMERRQSWERHDYDDG
ncbi:unnamed protein product [Heligmosomoides polygyrus]|uniref:Uncharacterized protein n=1 Tax=Heligmosomoides polygyrus TaxID=6339 RepID=A0A183F733_HELPZ|nr:unnamed protein product [Heligmosomoides polygyrus]